MLFVIVWYTLCYIAPFIKIDSYKIINSICCKRNSRGFEIKSTKECVILHSTDFCNCTSGSSSAGVDLEGYYAVCKINEIGTFYCCTFRNWNSGLRGGGLWVGNIPTEFKMQNTIFITCHTNNNWEGFFFLMVVQKIKLKGFYFVILIKIQLGLVLVNVLFWEVTTLKKGHFNSHFLQQQQKKNLLGES